MGSPAYSKERYQWYKARGVCVRCGQTWAEPGRVLCKACAKRQIALRRRSDPGGAKKAEWKKATKERRITDGMCLECGRPCDTKYKRCAKCLAKIRERAQVRRLKAKIRREAEHERSG